MIRPLRTRHRRALTALALVLPPLAVLALASRPEIPVRSEASPLAPPLGDGDGAAWPAADDAWRELGWSARVVRREGRRLLELRPRHASEDPDVLVYVASSASSARSGQGGDGDGLPADARLLGSIGSQPRGFVLPGGDADRVVLYSLGHRRVLGDAPLPGR